MNCQKCGYKLDTKKDFERKLCYYCYANKFYSFEDLEPSLSLNKVFFSDEDGYEDFLILTPGKTQLELINEYIQVKHEENKRSDLFDEYIKSKEKIKSQPRFFTFSNEDIQRYKNSKNKKLHLPIYNDCIKIKSFDKNNKKIKFLNKIIDFLRFK